MYMKKNPLDILETNRKVFKNLDLHLIEGRISEFLKRTELAVK